MYNNLTLRHILVFSPRPWGCFFVVIQKQCCKVVFPTSVGVFLNGYGYAGVETSFPHVRGGVSSFAASIAAVVRFSPRPGGCFCQMHRFLYIKLVFPTSVGVFLLDEQMALCTDCFPHVRGGVSPVGTIYFEVLKFSPRPWGCF